MTKCHTKLSLHYFTNAFSALTLLVGHQEEHPVCKNWVMRCWCGASFKSRPVLPFWYQLTGKEATKRMYYFTWQTKSNTDHHFPYIFFISLTASATSSFHHHVSLCLRGLFVIPHSSWAVSIIIPFICCQWSFTPGPFHFASSGRFSGYVCDSLTVYSNSFHAL